MDVFRQAARLQSFRYVKKSGEQKQWTGERASKMECLVHTQIVVFYHFLLSPGSHPPTKKWAAQEEDDQEKIYPIVSVCVCATSSL